MTLGVARTYLLDMYVQYIAYVSYVLGKRALTTSRKWRENAKERAKDGEVAEGQPSDEASRITPSWLDEEIRRGSQKNAPKLEE